MRILPILLLFALIVGCTDAGDPRLEGTWVSDRERTLASLSSESAFSEEQLSFLQRNLGELQFHFSGSKTAVSFTSDPDEPLQWEPYKVRSFDEESVSISIKSGARVEYTFDGNCIYMQAAWGYREHFCRPSDES